MALKGPALEGSTLKGPVLQGLASKRLAIKGPALKGRRKKAYKLYLAASLNKYYFERKASKLQDRESHSVFVLSKNTRIIT